LGAICISLPWDTSRQLRRPKDSDTDERHKDAGWVDWPTAESLPSFLDELVRSSLGDQPGK
jgi:hypothetical protein